MLYGIDSRWNYGLGKDETRHKWLDKANSLEIGETMKAAPEAIPIIVKSPHTLTIRAGVSGGLLLERIA